MMWIGLLLVTAAVSSSAPADTAPRPIPLAEAVALAQRNAPAIIQAEGQKRTSDAGVRAAYAAFLPSVSVSAGASRQLPTQAGQTRVENGQVVTLAPEPWSLNARPGPRQLLRGHLVCRSRPRPRGRRSWSWGRRR